MISLDSFKGQHLNQTDSLPYAKSSPVQNVSNQSARILAELSGEEPVPPVAEPLLSDHVFQRIELSKSDPEGEGAREIHIYHYYHNIEEVQKTEKTTNVKSVAEDVRRTINQTSFWLFGIGGSNENEGMQEAQKTSDEDVGKKEKSSKKNQTMLIEKISFFALGLFFGFVVGAITATGAKALLITTTALGAVIVSANRLKTSFNELKRIAETIQSIWTFSLDFWVELNRGEEEAVVQ